MQDLFHEEAESNKQPKVRTCLLCKEAFNSDWAGDRVCKRCKGTVAWRGSA